MYTKKTQMRCNFVGLAGSIGAVAQTTKLALHPLVIKEHHLRNISDRDCKVLLTYLKIATDALQAMASYCDHNAECLMSEEELDKEINSQ